LGLAFKGKCGNGRVAEYGGLGRWRKICLAWNRDGLGVNVNKL
jgi:hypothetical protein